MRERRPKHKRQVGRFGLYLYELAWYMALPLVLPLSSRLREGLEQRLLRKTAKGPVDIWIQGASAGEAYLALELVKRLSKFLSVRALMTSGTTQGMDILYHARRESMESSSPSYVEIAYFPLDIPRLMYRALRRWRPKLMVLLETELWPGLMSACQMGGVPVLLLNGRLSRKSLRVYALSSRFWAGIGPDKIYAISPQDQARFGEVFGPERVGLMNNMKFDRLNFEAISSIKENPVSAILPEETPFLVLGSVRKEEEEAVENVLRTLSGELPQLVIGLFPRHLHRINSWRKILDRCGFSWTMRSCIVKPVAPGTTILWDTFGELAQAYGRAQAAFVGGSLKPCGGQNFIEPLGQGTIPCIGPYWDNFAWVGREIIRAGLVEEVSNWEELSRALLQNLRSPKPREIVFEKAKDYIMARQGGAEQACRLIFQYL